MLDFWPRVRLFLVLLFALVVLAGAVYVIAEYPKAPASSLSIAPASTGTPPTTTPSPTASAAPTKAAVQQVLVVGRGLGLAAPSLAKAGFTVQSAPPGDPALLAAGALDGVTGTPDVVVLEVTAGSLTTTRTSAAIAQVQARWPDVRVVVVAPFSSQDRLSAAAARSAATASKVSFLDPFELKWRVDAASATLSAADAAVVGERLAAALQA